MIRIKNVIKNSPADKAGIKSGEFLVGVDGEKINDALDYLFYTVKKNPRIVLSGRKVLVKKDEYEDLGLEFDTFLMSDERGCENKCVFCFVDQLPREKLRNTLYFKDDDSRLSFLQGNYISLTNLTEREAERIIKMKLGLNVSVHTTDPDLRVKMLGNPKGGQALDFLYETAKAVPMNINCQIVICPGINDGAALDKTLSDLSALNINSVACVPVGLTKYRDSLNLAPLAPFDKQTAEAALEIIKKYEKYGNVYASDELFLIAERELPDFEYYNGFPQYENGVGMLRLFIHEFERTLKSFKTKLPRGEKSLATGSAAAPFLKKLTEEAGLNIRVFEIKNDFFGHSVTVAGLVTGADLINQLLPRKNNLGEELLIPSVMLKAGEDVFLDDITVGEAEAALSVKIRVLEVDGAELFE